MLSDRLGEDLPSIDLFCGRRDCSNQSYLVISRATLILKEGWIAYVFFDSKDI